MSAESSPRGARRSSGDDSQRVPVVVAGRLAGAGQAGRAHGSLKDAGRSSGVSFQKALGGPRSGCEVDAELSADFMALGFGYLVVELLTRQLRYMSNLDESSLQTQGRRCGPGVPPWATRETARSQLQSGPGLAARGPRILLPGGSPFARPDHRAADHDGAELRAELARPGADQSAV